jgi:hypothetical protein
MDNEMKKMVKAALIAWAWITLGLFAFGVLLGIAVFYPPLLIVGGALGVVIWFL